MGSCGRASDSVVLPTAWSCSSSYVCWTNGAVFVTAAAAVGLQLQSVSFLWDSDDVLSKKLKRISGGTRKLISLLWDHLCGFLPVFSEWEGPSHQHSLMHRPYYVPSSFCCLSSCQSPNIPVTFTCSHKDFTRFVSQFLCRVHVCQSMCFSVSKFAFD